MSWSKHECNRGTRFFSTRRESDKAFGFVGIAILSLLPALAISADRLPPAPPEGGGSPTPDPIPEEKGSGAPPIPPSRIDPGIQRVPEQCRDPRAIVKPPDLDPCISKNPDWCLLHRRMGTPPGREVCKESQKFSNVWEELEGAATISVASLLFFSRFMARRGELKHSGEGVG